jgi:glycosyltransferase involved in cell wall biosynthesis
MVMTTVAFVGTHDPGFGRVALLAAGLEHRGFTVLRCVEPVWGSTDARVAAARRGLANPALALRLIRAYARLARSVRALRPRPDALIVGYPGQLDAVVLRALLPRFPLVLDAFISLDETLADRGIGTPTSSTRILAHTIDRLAFRRADCVIVDTAAHARRFARDYGLDRNKVVVAPVGAPEPYLDVAQPDNPIDSAASTRSRHPSGAKQPPPMRVCYFGGFIPLHGVPVILDAAHRLGPDAGITFELVGDGQDADQAERRVTGEHLPHVQLHRTWVPEAELIAQHVANADVCLGIFADRPKTLDVVPAKLYLALACARPVVTADTPAVREEILAHAPSDAPPVLVCRPGDGDALASALLRLRDDPGLRSALARQGRRIYEERFTPREIVANLSHVIEHIAQGRRIGNT